MLSLLPFDLSGKAELPPRRAGHFLRGIVDHPRDFVARNRSRSARVRRSYESRRPSL
jgi:hypothetical protein